MQVFASIAGELRLDPLLEKILRVVSVFLDADRVTLFLYDNKLNELFSQVALGWDSQIRIPVTEGLCGFCYTSHVVVNVADAYQDDRFCVRVDRETGYRTRSVLCMPIDSRQGDKMGVLQALNKVGCGAEGARESVGVRGECRSRARESGEAERNGMVPCRDCVS